MTLDKAKVNVEYKISRIDPKLPYYNRLLEIGMIKGNKLKVVLTSPFNDIFIIDLDNYLLALQIDSLKYIEVEEYLCK